ncbi:hypothetical protein [Lysinibacillus telephonicus]|uniref:Uncharacterized protein n=1 Tax=Lysinibacillus telephonicus TaxID=1714840 RepID=A0A3S0JNH0_9BACI|nr:hypothetical protein [Lysinibacillus telephonicus]RTQ90391.1 hypothetical protein EKG35_15015 [Lysinibacillus telephonicus]
MKKKIFVIVLSLILIVIVNLFFFKPELNPDDISIDYEFKTNIDNQNYLQLKLNNSNKEINFSESNFYHIYFFSPNYIISPIIDYPNYQDEEYHIGMDTRTYNVAKNSMNNENININKYNSADGFYYNGENYPVIFDYYYYREFDNNNNHDTGYIVFSYYEKKLFKDLSWTKLYPITFE